MTLWIWRKVWDKRLDLEFEADKKVHRELLQMKERGEVVSDDSCAPVAERTALPAGTVAASMNRLKWARVIKPKRFNPPHPTVYQLTNKRPRRAALNGRRFRAPLRSDGQRWGPWPMEELTTETVQLSDRDAFRIIKDIKKRAPKWAPPSLVEEMTQDILVDVLAGVLPENKIEKRILSYLGKAGAKDTDGHHSISAPFGEGGQRTIEGEL